MPSQAQAHHKSRISLRSNTLQDALACCFCCLAQCTYTRHAPAICPPDRFKRKSMTKWRCICPIWGLTWDLTGSPNSHSWPCSQYSMGAAIPTSSSATCTAHRHCRGCISIFMSQKQLDSQPWQYVQLALAEGIVSLHCNPDLADCYVACCNTPTGNRLPMQENSDMAAITYLQAMRIVPGGKCQLPQHQFLRQGKHHQASGATHTQCPRWLEHLSRVAWQCQLYLSGAQQ